ncbi:hypothetical protein Bandiella_01333 [Candidatus Bandiella woodruffii]|uniref:Uncharacterized protein n=1 Tax=Candidatus Bandiella euplotis TaxID=1664265 RepID=A0ABZ0UN93_9RICK|nr:hypothetical protein Bandiella_01333 [Candidatus Bandiella woodruffii]
MNLREILRTKSTDSLEIEANYFNGLFRKFKCPLVQWTLIVILLAGQILLSCSGVKVFYTGIVGLISTLYSMYKRYKDELEMVV